jgi:hypothetical protein
MKNSESAPPVIFNIDRLNCQLNTMSYKCDKCEAMILSLRLGYCSNCREPIHIETLPEAKKQALAAEEREYEQIRDRIRAEKELHQQIVKQRGNASINIINISDASSWGDGDSWGD